MAIVFFTAGYHPIPLDYTFEEFIAWYAEKFSVSLEMARQHLESPTTDLTLQLPIGPGGAIVSRTGIIRIIHSRRKLKRKVVI